MTPTAKFATRNFLGKQRAFYLVEESAVRSEPAKVPAVSDLILVVDASGSMYGDMAAMRETILKVFTLDEYAGSKVRVTLISYSSKGDVVTHFERATIPEIMKVDSKHQKQIKSLAVRGLTCISQGLLAAREVAKRAAADGGTIAVQLLSDGYANDSSPTAEKREIDAVVASLKGVSNLFCNTIAFRACCDFQLLASVSNALSGSCIQAASIRQVYDTIYDTTRLVAGKSVPALQLPLGDYTQQVFVSRSARKILGAAGDLTVCGLASDDDRTVYRFKRVTEAAYKKAKLDEASGTAVYAFARAAISEGALNAAKYAMVSTRNFTLLQEHGRALTGEQIAAFADALDRAVFVGIPTDHVVAKTYGFAKPVTSVLDVCQILDAHRGGFSVDVAALAKGYRRRGIKRLLGTRGPDGKIVSPTLRVVYRDEDRYASVGGFDTNRNTATINMMVVQPVNLVRQDGSVVKDVAGIKLTDKLADYKQYTLVGDGAVNVPSLAIRIADKKLWKALEEAEVVSGDFVPGRDCIIDLASRPLVSYGATFDPAALAGLPERVLRLRVLSSLLGALLKDSSTSFTADQVKALKEHYLTEKLYTNFPTTVPYTDEKVAAATGEIDYKISFKVNFGVPEALSPGTLYSANEFLARWYACEGVADAKKPKLMEWWDSKFKARHKDRSKLKSITLVDTLMAEVFDDFFGLAPTGCKTIEDVVDREGLLSDAEFAAVRKVLDRKVAGDAAVQVLTDFRKSVDKALDDIFEKEVSPLVFYIGATGLIPDDFGELRALTAEQLVAQFPTAQLSKEEKEATFYVISGAKSSPVILSVFAKSEPYSTERGVQAVKAQQAAA